MGGQFFLFTFSVRTQIRFSWELLNRICGMNPNPKYTNVFFDAIFHLRFHSVAKNLKALGQSEVLERPGKKATSEVYALAGANNAKDRISAFLCPSSAGGRQLHH